MNKKDIISYEWENTGSLSIEICGNENATIRFAPSQSNIQKSIEKLNQRTHSNDFEETKQPHNQK